MARKQKERNETEFLKAENRRLKSEVRNLKKRLGTALKKTKWVKEYSQDDDDDYQEERSYQGNALYANSDRLRVKCPDCSNIVEPIELGTRWLYSCSNCGLRKTYGKKT